MGQPTQRYKKSMSGSVGAGMKSLFGGSGRRFFVLEHKVSSKYHRAGEEQQIIVDQVEIGRDSKCAVRLVGRQPDDPMFSIVSRKHAAIQKEGDNWVLVHLSNTNSTFLNGKKFSHTGQKWYLQNGDEIQIAENGPKLCFKTPQGDKGLVKSIGLTARMSLFRQQALRPYKTAIASLACVLVLCIAGGTWKILNLDKQLEAKSAQIAQLIELNSDNRQMVDSLTNELIATNQQMGNYEEMLTQMREETDRARRQAAEARNAAAEASRRAAEAARQARENVTSSGAPTGALKDQCFPHTYAVYQVKLVIRQPNGEEETDNEPRLVGSGFLLSDGRFITARHVTETWFYYHFNWGDERINNFLKWQNAIVHNGGDIEVSFVAISHSGDQISFTNKQCQVDRSGDSPTTATLQNGQTVVLKKSDVATADWVSFRTSKSGLPFDNNLSQNLPIGTNLQILGFPLGRGGENPRAVSPISSHAEVARDGLDVNGTIMTSNDDTQSGNSGGPVFVFENGKFTVVGILSGSTAGKGRVVPIKMAR